MGLRKNYFVGLVILLLVLSAFSAGLILLEGPPFEGYDRVEYGGKSDDVSGDFTREGNSTVLDTTFEERGNENNNLITWDSSPDDPRDVSHYNTSRSKGRGEPRDEPRDEPTDNVEKGRSTDYLHLGKDKRMIDDISWWYLVRSVSENGAEEDNTNKEQEPFRADHLEITPQESTITTENTQEYNATLYDEEGNEIREVTHQTVWSIDEGAGGNWADNIYTSESQGKWNITGTYSRDGEVFVDNATLIVLQEKDTDIDITNPKENDIFNVSKITVEWTSENVEEYKIKRDGGQWKNTTTNTSHILEDIDDGKHTIEVKGVDKAGHGVTESVEFLIDTTPPEVYFVSPEDGEVLNKDTLTVEWNYSDTPSGMNHFQIRINEGDWNQVSEFREYDFTRLSDGRYTVEIRAVDNAGNIGNETIVFEIHTESGSGLGLAESCVLSFLLTTIIAILLILGWYRWKEGEEEKERESSEKRGYTDTDKEKKMMSSNGPSFKEEDELEIDIPLTEEETEEDDIKERINGERR